MVEVFREYIQSKSSVSDAEWEQIQSYCQVKKLRKRQYLLQEGDVCVNQSFVTKGCLRTYAVNEKGNEHITNFAIENWWAADMESLASGKPSIFNIDALEDSVVIQVSKINFDKLCAEIPALNDMVNAILHRSFIAAQGRIHTFMSLTAEEKYLRFIEKYPQIMNRVPQGMVASYLGITPETLSRIRTHAIRKN
jgi:CRP-like cAMP-binding protein